MIAAAAAAGVGTSILLVVGVDLLQWRHALDNYVATTQKRQGGVPTSRVKRRDGSLVDVSSLWTVHNKRYDLTSFVRAHPGGAKAILLGRGRNCTALFESYHSLGDRGRVSLMLDSHLVPGIPDAQEGDADFDDSWDWKDTPFGDALISRVRQHFLDKGEDNSAPPARTTGITRRTAAVPRGSYKASTLKWCWVLFFSVVTAVCLWGFWHGSWLAMFLLPFCHWLGPSTMMHDG